MNQTLETSFTPQEELLIRGNLLDMWQLYKKLSKDNPDKLSDLTMFDWISARDNLPFPDFFHAVRDFLYPHRLSPYIKVRSEKESESLEIQLDETFQTMQANWGVNGPFFASHPELKFLSKLSYSTGFTIEFAEKLPDIRGANPNWFWSIETLNKLRGNLDDYIVLDKALKDSGIGTFFEYTNSDNPGDFNVFLKPENSGFIEPFLRLLKHGSFIGFGNVALAKVNNLTYVAVTMLQTDLLRTDHVTNSTDCNFTHTEMDRNPEDNFTVPSKIRLPLLSNYAWAQAIVQAIENAAVELSKKSPIAGIILPTSSSYHRRDSDRMRLHRGEYTRGIYELFPKTRGYQLHCMNPVFPLTERWAKGALLGSGEWWVKSLN